MSAQNRKQGSRYFVGMFILCAALFVTGQSFAATPVAQSRDSVQAAQANCVILERMGVVGQVTSRMLSLGVRGSEFQFVEGSLPKDVNFHNKLTEHDVRKLQAMGSDVVILDSDYLPTSLMEARESCLKATHKTVVQPSTAQVEIASTPAGSDIELDGKFVGSTPSMVRVPAGEHTVKLTKDGYTAWERTLTATSGSVRISPDLRPVASTTSSAGETTSNLDTVANNRF